MKILIIETTPATPHAETGLEIGLKENNAGSEVIYCPIFQLLPQLIWMSNINGNNNKASNDTTTDWLNYLTSIANKFSTIIIPDLSNINRFLPLNEINKNPLELIHDNQNFGKLVFANLVELIRDTEEIKILENFHLSVKLALTACISYEISKFLINQINPDKIVFFNGRTIETFPIYLAAKKSNTFTIIHERGPTKNHFTLWNNPPQYLKTYSENIQKFSLGRNEDARRLSASIFYSRQKSAKLSTMNYINSKQNHNQPLILESLSDKFIVFYTSSNWEIDSMPNQIFSNGLGDQYEVVGKLSIICKQLAIQFVLRLHPNSSKTEIARFNDLSEKNDILLIKPTSSISSYDLAENAYRIFTFGSTLTWELMFNNIHCAVLSQSVGTDFNGVCELKDTNSIIEYITNDLPAVNNSFSFLFADFMQNYGERYDYYKPSSLFSGVFDFELDRAT